MLHIAFFIDNSNSNSQSQYLRPPPPPPELLGGPRINPNDMQQGDSIVSAPKIYAAPPTKMAEEPTIPLAPVLEPFKPADPPVKKKKKDDKKSKSKKGGTEKVYDELAKAKFITRFFLLLG